MSPRVAKKPNINTETKTLKNNEVKNKIKEFQNYIKKNFEYVGDNFSYEARSIHYGNKKNKPIYGKASSEEVKDLKDEGIETITIPWMLDKEN